MKRNNKNFTAAPPQAHNNKPLEIYFRNKLKVKANAPASAPDFSDKIELNFYSTKYQTLTLQLIREDFPNELEHAPIFLEEYLFENLISRLPNIYNIEKLSAYIKELLEIQRKSSNVKNIMDLIKMWRSKK